MRSLNTNFEKSKTPQTEKAAVFGEGNFLRAFIGVLYERMNRNAGYDGGVVLLQGLPNGLAEKINAQEGLYTVIERGMADGKASERSEIIHSVTRCVDPYKDYGAFLKIAENPELQAVISNTTEFGICYAEDEVWGQVHKNYPAKLTDFLYRRFTFFHGAKEKGLVILPCELIDRNGDRLKENVERYVWEWGLSSDFSEWMRESCCFTNTLVDRIVSGYPRAEAEEYEKKLGYRDELLDVCEPFFLWVIEGDRARLSTIPFEKAGLDVIITDDLESYRTRKVRILNGAHTCSVPVGLLCGFNNVEQLVTDEVFGKYMKRAIFTEIIPSFSGEKRKEYAEQVIERFHNPFLDHKLLSIALNSLSKWKTRVLPSVVDYMEKFGKAPEVLTFSFAALYVYYKRGEGVRDDAHFLELTKRTASLREFLKLAEIWGEDLSKREMFTKKAEEYEKKISEIGIKKVVEELTSEA